MFNRKLKVGIIGIGNIGLKHANTYSKLTHLCELIGVYDPLFSDDSKEILETKLYNDLDILLNEVDAVSIAVPTKYHYKIALKCLRYGVHFFLEKPFTGDIAQWESLVCKSNKSNIKIQLGQIERFNPAFIALKSVIKPMDIRSITAKRFNYSNRLSETDVIFDLMVEDIYLIHNILGSKKVEFKKGSGYRIISRDFVDYAKINMIFDNQIPVTLESNRVSKENVQIISIQTWDKIYELDLLNKTLKYINFQGSTTELKVPQKDSLEAELTSFLKSIYTNSKPLATAYDGYLAIKTATLIRESICGRIRLFKSRNNVL